MFDDLTMCYYLDLVNRKCGYIEIAEAYRREFGDDSGWAEKDVGEAMKALIEMTPKDTVYFYNATGVDDVIAYIEGAAQ